MHRLWQLVLIGTFLPLCWLAMMGLHELGHVLAAWCTGGTVTQVVLHPLSISRTDVFPNPRPLLVAWSGAVVGVLLPLLVWLTIHMARWPYAYLLRFLAGFCLIANGSYLAFGSLAAVGDAGELLRLGAPAWSLWAFGVATLPAGLALWHGLGPDILGKARGRADQRAALVSAALLILAVTLTSLLSSRS